MRNELKQCQTWSNDRIDLTTDRPTPVAARTAWLHLVGALAALSVLALLLPDPSRCLEVLDGRSPGLAPGTGVSVVAETALLLVAALLVWALLLWGAAVVLVALAGRLPGRAGRSGRAVLVRIAPGVARKLLLTAVGASMVTGLAACGTGAAAAASEPGNGSSVGASHAMVHAALGRSADITRGESGVPGQATSWTSVEGSAVQLRSGPAGARPEDATGAPAGPAGQMDIDWPALPARAGSGAPPGPVDIDWPTAPAPVVVLAGDSLWSIAARHLPAAADDAQIEQAAREWYSANAAVIGDDPDLILPGQILQPPNQKSGHRS